MDVWMIDLHNLHAQVMSLSASKDGAAHTHVCRAELNLNPIKAHHKGHYWSNRMLVVRRHAHAQLDLLDGNLELARHNLATPKQRLQHRQR
jgi:hypothetical protein